MYNVIKLSTRYNISFVTRAFGYTYMLTSFIYVWCFLYTSLHGNSLQNVQLKTPMSLLSITDWYSSNEFKQKFVIDYYSGLYTEVVKKYIYKNVMKIMKYYYKCIVRVQNVYQWLIYVQIWFILYCSKKIATSNKPGLVFTN